MNEGFATKENIQEKISLILKGEDGGFLYEDGGVRKKYPALREEFKEILKAYGKTDEEIEKQLEIGLEPYQESDQHLYRILKTMMTAAQKSETNDVNKEDAEQVSQTPQKTAEATAPEEPTKEHIEEQPKTPEVPKNTLPEDTESFTEYLNSAVDGKPKAEVLERKIRERLDVLPALFNSVGIENEQEREKLLEKFGLRMERKWMEKESELLKEFFDLAENSTLDTNVIHSRFTQWKSYLNRTERFNRVLKEKLDAELVANTNKSSEREGLSNSRAEQNEDEYTLESGNYNDEDLSKKAAKRWKSQDAKVQKGEEPSEAENSEPTYDEAYNAWMEARKQSDAAETEYRNALADHYKKLGDQNWFSGERMKYEYQKLFGIAPKLTDELQALQQKTIEMRNAYKRNGAELAIVKYTENGEKSATVIKRYERLLAQKLVVRNFAERNNLQQEIAKEKYSEGTPTQKLLETMKKYRYVRMAGTVGVYALVGFATGGVGAAGIAGGSRAAAMFSGLVAGGAAGLGTQSLLEKFYVAKHENAHEEKTKSTRTSLFDTDIAALEAEFAQSATQVANAKRNAKIASVGAAAAAGIGAGEYTASNTSELGTAVAAEPDQQQEVSRSVVQESIQSESSETNALPVSSIQNGGPATESIAESGYDEAPAPTKIYSESLLETQKAAAESSKEAIPDGIHTVAEGDNLWNLVENRYKETLDTLPTDTARNVFVDSILDRLSSDEELRQHVGLERPNIDLIKPGEELNLAALDTIAAEISKSDIQVDTEAPAAEPAHEPTTKAEVHQERIGDMHVGDVLVLAEQVSTNDPAALAKLESLGVDKVYLLQMAEWVRSQNGGNIDTTRTLDEFSHIHEQNNNIEPDETKNSEPAVETTAESTPQENNLDAAQVNIIESVEGKKGLLDGVFGSNGTAGTYEKIKDLTMEDLGVVLLKEERQRDQWLAKNGISEEGWVNWINWISQKAEPLVPVDQKLTFSQYVASVASATAAQKTANTTANVQ